MQVQLRQPRACLPLAAASRLEAGQPPRGRYSGHQRQLAAPLVVVVVAAVSVLAQGGDSVRQRVEARALEAWVLEVASVPLVAAAVVGLERRRLAALVLLRLVVGLVQVVALGQGQEQCRRLALAVAPLRRRLLRASLRLAAVEVVASARCACGNAVAG